MLVPCEAGRDGGGSRSAGRLAHWRLLALVGMTGLCIAAYLRALGLPFIADDYIQISLARDHGPISGWSNLASDALYRCRATSLVLTYWTERLFGLSPLAFNWSSLVLHIINTWLVFALGYWRVIGWRVSAVTACFFAIFQGHQEAVIWYAALPELLVFLFALASFLFWILWLQASRGRCWYYAASLACFILALLSKEPAVAVVGLLVLAVWLERRDWRRRMVWILPFAMLAVVYFIATFAGRAAHQHFSDGTFSLSAPFWIVLPRSVGRLLWIWGLVSLVALTVWRARRWAPLLGVAGAWIVITLLPYSFLTYMPHVPSRHTYFASAGLALVVAAGFLTFQDRFRARTWAVCLLAALITLHHCGYLWSRKHRQFLDRAAPTERLIEFARHAEGPIYLRCFPYSLWVAREAVGVRLGKTVNFIGESRGGPAQLAQSIDCCLSQQ